MKSKIFVSIIPILLLGLFAFSQISDNSISENTASAIHTKVDDFLTETMVPPQITKPYRDIVLKEYDPKKWTLIYDKDMVWNIEIVSPQKIWIESDGGDVINYDDGNWISFSGKDFGFFSKPSDLAVGPNGAIWVAGKEGISRYQNKHWTFFPFPNSAKYNFVRLAVDQTGVVWFATPMCNCENEIKFFDGVNWGKINDPKLGDTQQLLFSPSDSLWSIFEMAGKIGQYDGKNWKFFPGDDIWPKSPYFSAMRIASNEAGEIYAISDGQDWIITVDKFGSLNKIPFNNEDLLLNPFLLRLYIDKQNSIWINACLKDRSDSCLAYYKNNVWTSFTNLPFSTVTDIKELDDHTILLATENGLYKYLQ